MTSNLPESVQWVAALAPVGTLTIAALAAAVGWRTLRQRREADARTHWWDRTRWAIEQVEAGGLTSSTVGVRVLRVQADSALAGAEENKVIEAVWEPIVGPDELGIPDDAEAALRYLVEDESGEGK
ncbi:hypothetical protein MF406_03790 [Georgenia sp. TF02-10]|uniref:hypothetical protein n=1 Tax=Georgenia sp. TF02-10 TaxID=2917725 RepID=UPI001FA7E328|nr:hypothetical protein [Georgenia sp. TF02-10]UNX55401.1 hypothetical protein MF406_03790 [Georgenia sp. TF02-10]